MTISPYGAGRVIDLGVCVSIFALDGVENALHGALDGLSLRQSVTADNIANVDTPGFRARSVDFETSLRSAIVGGNVTLGDITVSSAATSTPVGANDNNVDLRKETMAAMQSVFQYQVVSRSVNDRLTDLRTAAGAF
jgi:flagellar basal-body rod protein FlgB